MQERIELEYLFTDTTSKIRWKQSLRRMKNLHVEQSREVETL